MILLLFAGGLSKPPGDHLWVEVPLCQKGLFSLDFVTSPLETDGACPASSVDAMEVVIEVPKSVLPNLQGDYSDGTQPTYFFSVFRSGGTEGSIALSLTDAFNSPIMVQKEATLIFASDTGVECAEGSTSCNTTTAAAAGETAAWGTTRGRGLINRPSPTSRQLLKAGGTSSHSPSGGVVFQSANIRANPSTRYSATSYGYTHSRSVMPGSVLLLVVMGGGNRHMYNNDCTNKQGVGCSLQVNNSLVEDDLMSFQFGVADPDLFPLFLTVKATLTKKDLVAQEPPLFFLSVFEM